MNVKHEYNNLYFLSDEFGDEIVDDQPVKQVLRAKYLKFIENRRPAYYGTWRKKSVTLGPRKPFGKDKVCNPIAKNNLIY